jgi:DNA-directed RNA polymerase subunit RPC12/RpoP
MYECFHCGAKAVIWDNDFSFEDYGEEGEGIIHVCHCSNCGAQIEYRISVEDDEDDM